MGKEKHNKEELHRCIDTSAKYELQFDGYRKSKHTGCKEDDAVSSTHCSINGYDNEWQGQDRSLLG